MSTIIDFNGTKREAFVRGFLKGLAAPVALFSTHTPPEVPQVPMIEPPSHPNGDAGALASDWARIGHSLQMAVGRYEQQAQAPDAKAKD